MATVRVLLALGMVALVAWATAWMAADLNARDGAMTREVHRIQQHLLGAEKLLTARDASGLPAEARASRARLIVALRLYRERARFPHNTDAPRRRVPTFVDTYGTPCAVAYLIQTTGDSDLVARVAASRNHARIRELTDQPQLVEWLGRNGLSIDEAARIQPAYGYDRPDHDMGVQIMTGTTLGLEATSIMLNLDRAKTGRGRAWRGGLGVFAGFTGTIAGVVILQVPSDQSPSWGGACIALGLVSVVMGGHQQAERRQSATLTSIAPIVRQRSGQPFVGLSARF